MIQFIFLILGIVLIAFTREMFSKHNAVFYYKGRKKDSHPIIEKWKDNIHILANQSYRSLFGAALCLYIAILYPMFGWLSILYSIILVMLTSASVSYHWQKWINLSVGLPEIDPDEKKEYELIIFGKSYWISKFWYGKRRYWISIISSICLFIFIILLYLGNINVI